ncbi:MAG: VWA domain-containing protein [Muribaculaceae bacterium]|nr:VWA domain-containing protein [Muribaculaceae bacterium]
MFSFANPEFFWLLLLLPAIVGLFLLSRMARKRNLERFGKQEQLQELMPDVSSRKPVVRLVIILLLLTMVIVMLARPRAGSMEKVKGEVKGIEVVIAMDVSNSMNASSTSSQNGISRLQRSKMVMEKLIDHLRNDKVGLVVFAGKAMMQMPMTIDGASAKMFLNNISTDMIPLQGTNIGDAIDLAMHTFSQDEKVSRTIILITDAENFEGDAEDAAKRAHKKNIQVNVIGIGDKDVPIPTDEGDGWMRDDNGDIAMTSFSEEQAKNIAEAGGGIFVKGDATDAVNVLDDALKKLATNNMSQYTYSREDEQFPVFAWIALALLIASVLLLNRKNPWLAKKNFFKRKVKDNNEE